MTVRALKIVAAVLLCVPLSGCFLSRWVCAPQPSAVSTAKSAPAIFLAPVSFSALSGWGDDKDMADAIPALQKSCVKISKHAPAQSFGPLPYAGTYADWQKICRDLEARTPVNTLAARQFMQDNFTPYAVEAAGKDGAQGLFTGYYEPLLHGSLQKSARYDVPLYARPSNLITVNLGDFKKALKGQTVMGRVAGEKLVPYYTRAQIDAGALAGAAQSVVWVDNAVDAFFLHIQGSGIVQMEDGTLLRVGYAAQNGRAYTAIGKTLVEKGALKKENVSMQSIRAWLETHPAEAPAVMDVNQSFVFFRALASEGPLGAEGVALTPARSLAIDRHVLPYGAPVWLDAQPPETGGARLQRLMVAQDTGGAINGAVRGDFFWGSGAVATHNAGVMKSQGRYYIFLPKTVSVPHAYLK